MKMDEKERGHTVGFKSRTRRTGLLLREMRLIFFPPALFFFFQLPSGAFLFLAGAPHPSSRTYPSPSLSILPRYSQVSRQGLAENLVQVPRLPSLVSVSCAVGRSLSIITRSPRTTRNKEVLTGRNNLACHWSRERIGRGEG